MDKRLERILPGVQKPARYTGGEPGCVYKDKKDVQLREGREFLSRTFDNSLPSFIAAFTQNKALSKEEIAQIQRLIDAYKEET